MKASSLCYLLALTCFFYRGNCFSQETFAIDSVINLITNEPDLEKQLILYEDHALTYINSGGSVDDFLTFDSLFINAVNSKGMDSYKLNSLLYTAKMFFEGGLADSAKSILLNLKKESKNKNNYIYYDATKVLSQYYLSVQKYNQAKEEAFIILNAPSQEINDLNRSHGNYLLGLIYQEKGLLNLSAKYILVADSLLPDNNRTKTTYYSTLADVFRTLGNYSEAEKYVMKALDISQKNDDDYQVQFLNLYLGAILGDMDKLQRSDSVLNLSQAFFNSIDDSYMSYEIDQLLGMNEMKKHRYNSAITIFESCLIQNQLYQNPIAFCELHKNLSNCYLNKNELDKAKVHLDSAFYYMKAFDVTYFKIDLLKTQERYFLHQNEYKKAHATLTRIDSLEKKSQKESNDSYINELKYFYETEKKEKENLILKSEKEEIKRSKQNQFYQLLIGMILLALGLIIVYLLYKNRQRSNQKLKELDTLKSKFFESISHELRTPLTLIQLPVTKSLDTGEAIPKNELKTINYNTKRLQNLMDDLLSITRIEANKYPLEIAPNNITEQVTIVSAQFDSLAESNSIKYLKNIPSQSITAHYDKEIVNKILINLISNAIKYSENSGTVKVSFEITNNQALLEVSDQGKGIKKEDQQYIFDKFYRVDQNNENVPGSGIGLSIVKELLGIINGSITVESIEGKGAKFSVKFPLHQVEIGDKQFDDTKGASIQSPLRSKKEDELAIENADKPYVLVVEDNQELLTYIQEELSNDFKVFVANNGKLGIEKGIEIVPDLIISDWLMPEKNGIELCEAIKSNEITSHVPVMLLTAKTEVEDKIKGFETGADAYIAKPFEMNILKAQVKNIIKQRKNVIEKFNQDGSQVVAKDFSERELKFWNTFKNLVDENLSNSEFSIQTLANTLFMSRMQLNRKVKALTQTTGSEYILKQKIKLTKQLLANKDLQISEIAYKVGYDNVNSFSRFFKKEVGSSPSDYRKQLN